MSANPQTVLITGANGLTGQKLVQLLANRQAIDLVATGRGDNRNRQREGYTYEALDLTDGPAVEQLFADHPIQAVIHTAAMTNVDACEQDPEACQAHNVTAVRNLLAACTQHGARLIHLSTDFVFDGEASPYDERATPNPLSVYGQAKLDAEALILASNGPHAILRTILVYGHTPGMSRSNIVLWVKQSLEKGETIRVVTDQFRSPTLAEDLADACVAALSRRATGLYHIGGPEVYSVYEIAQRVARFWKLDEGLITPITSDTLSQPAKRPPRTGFIILKAQTELGYQPHRFEDGLALVDRQLKQHA